MSKKRRTVKSASSGLAQGHRRGSRGKAGSAARGLSLIWFGVGLVVVAAVAFFLIRTLRPSVTEIAAAQAYEKYHAGDFFLDVRTQEEWNQGHIANSVLIPLDELANRLSEVPREQDVVVVCRSGPRSREGAAILQQAGYARVSCLRGGLEAWMAAGYGVEQ